MAMINDQKNLPLLGDRVKSLYLEDSVAEIEFDSGAKVTVHVKAQEKGIGREKEEEDEDWLREMAELEAETRNFSREKAETEFGNFSFNDPLKVAGNFPHPGEPLQVEDVSAHVEARVSDSVLDILNRDFKAKDAGNAGNVVFVAVEAPSFYVEPKSVQSNGLSRLARKIEDICNDYRVLGQWQGAIEINSPQKGMSYFVQYLVLPDFDYQFFKQRVNKEQYDSEKILGIGSY